MAHKAPGRSDRHGISVMELFQMFPDEAAARKWLEDIRWPEDQRTCPHCGSLKTAVVKNENPMPYHCGDCREYFSVKTGTVMQSSKVPLQKWVIAMYLLSTSLKGVSSMKLHRDLGLTQKTAWMLAQKIREGWIDGGGKLSGEVEIDETFMGGKERNKHRSQRLKSGRGTVGKSAVIGAKARDGKIKAEVIAKTDTPTLEGFVAANVESGSAVFTDEHSGYARLSASYDHQTVKHSVGEYVNGQAHTNGIESFWSMLKRGYKGTYHKMSAKHLARYVTEFAGRHNVRDLDTLAQMVALARGLEGRRLRYDDLVADNA
jgi:transposase-like protein